MTAELSDELIDEICGHIANGSTYESACKMSRVSARSFQRWRKKGREDEKNGIESLYSRICRETKTADAKYKQVLIDRIKKAGEKARYWTANAWLLERKFPDEFARRAIDVNVRGGVKILKVDIKLSAEEEREFAKRLQDFIGEEKGSDED